ncbi:MAG: hypothetical protein Q4D04_13405 [Clostridia bacterium]|nr:hypothetical protein [Clostridia bacterium]
MEKSMGMVCWLCAHALKKYFDSDRENMAAALMVGRAELNRALDSHSTQDTQTVLEALFRYCIMNHYSIDAMMVEYKRKE